MAELQAELKEQARAQVLREQQVNVVPTSAPLDKEFGAQLSAFRQQTVVFRQKHFAHAAQQYERERPSPPPPRASSSTPQCAVGAPTLVSATAAPPLSAGNPALNKSPLETDRSAPQSAQLDQDRLLRLEAVLLQDHVRAEEQRVASEREAAMVRERLEAEGEAMMRQISKLADESLSRERQLIGQQRQTDEQWRTQLGVMAEERAALAEERRAVAAERVRLEQLEAEQKASLARSELEREAINRLEEQQKALMKAEKTLLGATEMLAKRQAESEHQLEKRLQVERDKMEQMLAVAAHSEQAAETSETPQAGGTEVFLVRSDDLKAPTPVPSMRSKATRKVASGPCKPKPQPTAKPGVRGSGYGQPVGKARKRNKSARNAQRKSEPGPEPTPELKPNPEPEPELNPEPQAELEHRSNLTPKQVLETEPSKRSVATGNGGTSGGHTRTVRSRQLRPSSAGSSKPAKQTSQGKAGRVQSAPPARRRPLHPGDDSEPLCRGADGTLRSLVRVSKSSCSAVSAGRGGDGSSSRSSHRLSKLEKKTKQQQLFRDTCFSVAQRQPLADQQPIKQQDQTEETLFEDGPRSSMSVQRKPTVSNGTQSATKSRYDSCELADVLSARQRRWQSTAASAASAEGDILWEEKDAESQICAEPAVRMIGDGAREDVDANERAVAAAVREYCDSIVSDPCGGASVGYSSSSSNTNNVSPTSNASHAGRKVIDSAGPTESPPSQPPSPPMPTQRKTDSGDDARLSSTGPYQYSFAGVCANNCETWESALAAAGEAESYSSRTVVGSVGSVVAMPDIGTHARAPDRPHNHQERHQQPQQQQQQQQQVPAQPQTLRGSYEYASALSSSLLSEFPVALAGLGVPSVVASGRQFGAGAIAEIAAGAVDGAGIATVTATGRTTVPAVTSTAVPVGVSRPPGRPKARKNRTSLFARQSKNDMSAKPTALLPVEQWLAQQRKETAEFLEEAGAISSFASRMRAF